MINANPDIDGSTGSQRATRMAPVMEERTISAQSNKMEIIIAPRIPPITKMIGPAVLQFNDSASIDENKPPAKKPAIAMASRWTKIASSTPNNPQTIAINNRAQSGKFEKR